MKEARGYTNQQIADMTGIPLGTIGKYFAGIDDESATYEIVRKLVMCLDGSLDELAGIKSQSIETVCGGPAESEIAKAHQTIIAGLEARLAEKDERILYRSQLAEGERQRASESLEYERKRARTATIVSYVVLGIFAVMTLIDWIFPTVGWIRR